MSCLLNFGIFRVKEVKDIRGQIFLSSEAQKRAMEKRVKEYLLQDGQK